MDAECIGLSYYGGSNKKGGGSGEKHVSFNGEAKADDEKGNANPTPDKKAVEEVKVNKALAAFIQEAGGLF
jgi:hypothetical protein